MSHLLLCICLMIISPMDTADPVTQAEMAKVMAELSGPLGEVQSTLDKVRQIPRQSIKGCYRKTAIGHTGDRINLFDRNHTAVDFATQTLNAYGTNSTDLKQSVANFLANLDDFLQQLKDCSKRRKEDRVRLQINSTILQNNVKTKDGDDEDDDDDVDDVDDNDVNEDGDEDDV